MNDESKPKPGLPAGAKLVFKGIIHDIYQWEQEMFDGSKATFERIRRPDTTAVIAVVGDRIMLSEQEQPFRGSFTTLPGGRCEEGEATIDGARREMLEETGYVSDDVFLWKSYSPVSTVIWKDDYYIARDCRKVQEPAPDCGEKITNRLITFDEFLLLTDDELFRHKLLMLDLMRLRLHPEKQSEFKKLLFGK